jgi:ribosome biogenesis protein SSF1/2
VKPSGLSKSVKRLLKTEIPDLKNFESISDYILRGGEGYESDGSDVDTNKVELPQEVRGAGNTGGSQSAVRLIELGPRMQLQLLKIQDGFNDGEVLFHKHLTKTDAEVKVRCSFLVVGGFVLAR